MSIERIRRGTKNRKRLFFESGLRPFQIAMGIGVWLSVLSVIGAVWYYWSQTHRVGYLFSPMCVVITWMMCLSSYHRNNFRLSSIVAGVSFVMSLRNVAIDYFCLVYSVGLAMVIVFALIICAKMKDPRFSS
jgi:hypothetical protein